MRTNCRLTALGMLSLWTGAVRSQGLEDLESALQRLPRFQPSTAEILQQMRQAQDEARVSELRPLYEARLRLEEQRNTVLEYAVKLRARESEIGRVRGSVTFGTTGDTTSTQDQFKASAGIDFSVGTYPSQLRVLTKADVRNTDDELTEDVSTFAVSFDHYFFNAPAQDVIPLCSSDRPASAPNLATVEADGIRRQFESYGFIERFSDSFMSINRRFEVGGGVKLEWHSARLTPKGCGTLKALEALRAEHQIIEAAFNAQAGITDPGAADAFAGLYPKTILHNRAQFARNEYSKWETGLALSLFRESERPAEMTATILDAGGAPVEIDDVPVVKKLAPPTLNGERFTVRPSLVWRPREDVKISWVYYYKMKLGADSRVDGVRDVRRDLLLTAEWAVSELTKGRGQPTIVLALDRHEDSIPPNLTTLIPAEAIPLGGVTFAPLTAEREHRQVRLEVKVNF